MYLRCALIQFHCFLIPLYISTGVTSTLMLALVLAVADNSAPVCYQYEWWLQQAQAGFSRARAEWETGKKGVFLLLCGSFPATEWGGSSWDRRASSA